MLVLLMIIKVNPSAHAPDRVLIKSVDIQNTDSVSVYSDKLILIKSVSLYSTYTLMLSLQKNICIVYKSMQMMQPFKFLQDACKLKCLGFFFQEEKVSVCVYLWKVSEYFGATRREKKERKGNSLYQMRTVEEWESEWYFTDITVCVCD